MPILLEKTAIFDSEEERRVLGKAFFNLANHWQLSHEEEARLLGWSYKTQRTRIDNMRRCKMGLPPDQDKFERVRDLVNIHKSLRILFPNQRKLAYEWIKIPRERFGGHSALDVMLESGRLGIAAIRHYLDYERTR